jgi:hypothetical protein
MENKRASSGFIGTALGAAMTALQGTHPEWFGNHPWILPVSLLILLGSLLFWLTQYHWFQKLLSSEPKASSPDALYQIIEKALADVLSRTQMSAKTTSAESRLKIIEAHYGVEGINDPDVTAYLLKRQAGNSFAEPIGADLFGAFDPVDGKLKRLKVRYSYDGKEATIERPQHAWLILPEDAFLKRQVDELKPIAAVFPPLQFRLIGLAKRLRKMLAELPSPGQLNHAGTSEERTALMVRHSEWDQKIVYRYEGAFSSEVGQLESHIGKDDLPLAHCLSEFNANSRRVMHSKDIEALIETLWYMARIVDGRGV